MKLTTLLASSAALAAIAIAVPATIAPNWGPVATAQAATSISFSLFYDGLDDYGDWVSHDGDYVFVPVIATATGSPTRKATGSMPGAMAGLGCLTNHLAGRPTTMAAGASMMKSAGIGFLAPAGPRLGSAGAAVATMWPGRRCRRIEAVVTTSPFPLVLVTFPITIGLPSHHAVFWRSISVS